LAARRREVARDEGRRRRRVLGALCVVTLVALGAIVALNSALLDVDEIGVVGASSADPSTIVALTGIQRGEPLFEIDLDAAAAAVEQLPWVASATVERGLDGTVTVNVVERVAVAALPTEGGHSLVDAEGRQLAVVPELPPGFLTIDGIHADGTPGQPAPAEAHAVLRLLADLSPAIAPMVSRVTWQDEMLSVELVSGGRVKLGDDTALDEKMVSLETILARVDLRCLGEIDVRVPSAPAVTRVNADGDPRTAVVDLAECT
jgi:cell division protein FtsQ